MKSAIIRINKDLKDIQKNPLEGIYVELKDESNPFEWIIYMEGPTETPFEGGVFKLEMKFPDNYPQMPPSLRFLSEFWHPNVYGNGNVCISILHPPGDDPTSGELASERWCPTQSVDTILLSVQSMLSEPNMFSPANTDAMKQLRDHKSDYLKKCKVISEKARKELPAHIKIPHPDTDMIEKQKQVDKLKGSDLNFSFGMDDDYFDDEEGEEIIYSDEEFEEDE